MVWMRSSTWMHPQLGMHPRLGMIRGSDKIPWLGMFPQLGMIGVKDEILDSDGPLARNGPSTRDDPRLG
jgi:hypothetical protein